MSSHPSTHHPADTRRGMRFLVPALLLSLVLPAQLLASSPASLAPGGEGIMERILLADGQELHRTDNLVRGLQTIDVPDSGLQLFLWEEEKPNGERTSHYAFGEDGAKVGQSFQTSYAVELASHRFDPLVHDEPAFGGGLDARADNRLFLVQLYAQPLPELQSQIRGLGGEIHRYLTRHAMIVEMDAGTRGAVSALPYVRWVGAYHPGYRVEPVLLDALEGRTANPGAQRYSLMLTERGDDLQAELGDTIRALGGKMEVVTPSGMRIEATLSLDQLRELTHDGRVQYIDRWGGPAETDMDIVRIVGGGDYIQDTIGFLGDGVKAEIFDTETRFTHQEWQFTPMLHSPTNSGGLHGSSCMSNVLAQGTDPQAKGMAPNARGIFFDVDDATQFGGSVSRHDANAELLDPAGPYRAVVQTSSVGNARTTSYTTISAETDDYLFLHQLLSTQSQSNAGARPSRPQAWSKNIVSVGGFRHQGTADRSDDTWNFTGSIGPAPDDRIKPDLSYFYDGIYSASGASDTSYTGFGGTSSATPQTAGHFALLFEMWHEGVWPGHGGGATVFDSRPNVATAKALMIHNAFRYDWNSGGANSDLDRFKQGWGTAHVGNLYDNAPDTFVIDESEILLPLATYTTTASVATGDPEFKATLVYMDPAGTAGAAVQRINNLDLKVTAPDGTIYWGNNGLIAGNVSTSGGVANELDTVENVFIQNPMAGTWTVEVIAAEVVQDSHVETGAVDVDFALVVSPNGLAVFRDGFESGDLTNWDGTGNT